MSKLRIWNQHTSWDSAEKAWDEVSQQAKSQVPLKTQSLPLHMPAMTKETRSFFKWKALKWMVLKDHQRIILKHFLKHPFKYSWNYFKSLMKKSSYHRKEDFFFYNIKDENALIELAKEENSLFILGFSYCHKPFECPSGRFTASCIHDSSHPVCQQCFIGKSVHALKEERAIPLFIPTVHYIAEKILELKNLHPDKQILFLITACEMTLEMFGDWGNMAAIRGIGVRLDGRICNTMRAFELSENGIKPGLTVVLPSTQKRMLEILKALRS